ncbi:unnamed protein product [Camellia sinensis]
MALRGMAFCKVSPNLSLMSISSGSIPPPSFQSKEWIREANMKCTIRYPNGSPGHILLPAPKGMSSKSWPLMSTSRSKNLSGSNEFGHNHMLESRPIAHTLTRTCAFLGTMKPHISTSASALWGISNGPGGCNRRVSFTTACRFVVALDGGLDIPHSDKRFSGFLNESKHLDAEVHRKYIYGGHVAAYMKILMEDEPNKYQSHFVEYIKRGIEPDGIEELYKKVHAAIHADPIQKKSEKEPPKQHKREILLRE